MIKEAIKFAIEGRDLTSKIAESSMKEIMNGDAEESQISALLTALRVKGEAVEEISAFAKVMREFCRRINPHVNGTLVDTCGTGGDSVKTFNVSTAAALVAAGAGVTIAKHGNRSVTSKSGSADVLEALGVNIELSPEEVEKCLEETGFGFMFAPNFHPAMKYAMPVRKQIGIRTVYNILGPLTNPANAQAQVLGVFDPELTETMAKVLKLLRTKRALVVHSEGMDEIGIGKTKISELKNKVVKTYFLDGKMLGFSGTVPKISSCRESARTILNVLEGNKNSARGITLLNAAAAIYVGGEAETLEEGIEIAGKSIDNGSALEKLEVLNEFEVDMNGHS